MPQGVALFFRFVTPPSRGPLCSMMVKPLMMLSGFLSSKRIMINLPECRRRDVIHVLAERFASDLGGQPSSYAEPLLEREKLGSTAIGRGIALPHATLRSMREPAAALAVLESTCKFPTPDDVGVDIVIAFLSPDGPPTDLNRIAGIVRELREKAVVDALRSATTPDRLIDALQTAEGIS